VTDEQEEKSLKERIDPGGKDAQRIAGLEALASFGPVRWLLKRNGADPDELLSKIREQRGVYADLISWPDRIAAALSPLGWPYFGSVPSDAYREATQLAEAGKTEEAEQLLEDAWNELDTLLRLPKHRVFGLYGPDWDYETGMSRQRLFAQAIELHFSGHYAGAVSIVLPQMEGIFIDMTGKGASDFFERNNRHLLDDQTLPGHSLGLKALARYMTRAVTKTQTKGVLTRHGILHGRELGYDTRRNSTKALVGALALIEWAQPRAVAIHRRAAEERNIKYAGSKEVDPVFGRRLDRRSFDEAQQLLRDIHRLQGDYDLKHQRYAPDRKTLDRRRTLKGDYELRATPDGQQWWAWVVTEPGVVFGLASRDGDLAEREFFAEETPTGGIDQDERWQNQYEPGSVEYPDWLD
jgi:hypothetical protein